MTAPGHHSDPEFSPRANEMVSVPPIWQLRHVEKGADVFAEPPYISFCRSCSTATEDRNSVAIHSKRFCQCKPDHPIVRSVISASHIEPKAERLKLCCHRPMPREAQPTLHSFRPLCSLVFHVTLAVFDSRARRNQNQKLLSTYCLATCQNQSRDDILVLVPSGS